MRPAASPRVTGLTKAVADARRLLDYAVSRSLVKDASIVDAIIAIDDDLNSEVKPPQQTVEAFLKAYNNLSGLTDGVSAASLTPEAELDAARTRVLYSALLLLLLIVLVPTTTITLVGKQMIKETLDNITWICNNEDQTLHCREQNTQAPSATVTNQFSHPYETSLRTTRIFDTMLKLARFVIDKPEPPPWSTHDLSTNFQDVRYYADKIIASFNLLYDTVAGCLLPIAFAGLGAVTFGLRDLRQRLEERTWTRQGQALPVLRVIIASLAGFLISLFSDFTAKSGFSPIAFAFIVGYSVDVFFSFIDAVVARLRTPTASAAKTA